MRENILAGIVPVASGWDTDPTNLAYCTNNDWSVATGTGSTNKAGAGDVGYLVFDLGSKKTVLVGGRVGLWSASSRDIGVFVEGSDDDATYRGITDGIGCSNFSSIVFASGGTEDICDMIMVLLSARYIRIRTHVSGAANTANAKFYEIYGLEVS